LERQHFWIDEAPVALVRRAGFANPVVANDQVANCSPPARDSHRFD